MKLPLDRTKFLLPPGGDLKKARRIQDRLKKSLLLLPFSGSRFLVAGIDVSYDRNLKESSAAIVVMAYPQFAIREISHARTAISFPYVPGYLAFREIPPILEAWEKLRTEPDLLLVDGHGLAHPRRFGLACHLGILLDKPSIGCAKEHFYGEVSEPDPEKGSFTYVTDSTDGSHLGAALRSRTNVACIYVSPGHRMDLVSAIKTTFSLILRYRIPEPSRFAHTYSKKGWE